MILMGGFLAAAITRRLSSAGYEGIRMIGAGLMALRAGRLKALWASLQLLNRSREDVGNEQLSIGSTAKNKNILGFRAYKLSTFRI